MVSERDDARGARLGWSSRISTLQLGLVAPIAGEATPGTMGTMGTMDNEDRERYYHGTSADLI